MSEAASAEEIKSAFKTKARLYHPDKHKGDITMEERFKEINEAYQVLKNPYDKARYDLMRQYQSAPEPEITYTYQQPQSHYGRTTKDRPSFDYRENWIATGYAFAFSLAMALLVMIGIYIKREYDASKYAELMAKRRASFELAIQNHNEGKTREALLIMNELGGFGKSENDMEAFRESLIKESIKFGERYFKDQKFERAIYYYKLINDLISIPPTSVKENLALSYRKANQPENAAMVLNELLVRGYRNLFIYMQLGFIYRDDLYDTDKGIEFLEKARDLAIEYYEAIYGKAYVVVLDGSILPQQHRELFDELAQSYFDNSRYNDALAICNWIKRVWPDYAKNYILTAKIYMKLSLKFKACENYAMATSLDRGVRMPDECY